MRVLIDIGHPAHVHYFKNLAVCLLNDGSDVLFTAREKEVAIQLLDYYGFKYANFGKPFKSRLGKLWGLIWFTWKTYLISLRFKPDIYLNATMYSAIIAWLMRKPHIALEDTFNMEQVRLYLPFTSAVITGNYDHPDLGSKQIRISGYQELLYLHPFCFRPDPKIKSFLGINDDDKYVVFRFVAWGASHDYGHTGISNKNKLQAVEVFSKYAKIFISSEGELPGELEKFRLKIPPYRMHDVLASATFIFSESATMVSEAAVLGVPGIYVDSTGRFYTKDQEKYGMVFNFAETEDEQEKAIQKGKMLLKIEDTKKVFAESYRLMMAAKIDMTAFLFWFIKEYPHSKNVIKENPDYQFNFI
jgi:Uncharacterized protein conserved in archaea